MKDLQCVLDLSPDSIGAVSYDAVILCSGFELRCTHIPQKFHDLFISSHVAVLGFADDQNDPEIIKNDLFFGLFSLDPPS